MRDPTQPFRVQTTHFPVTNLISSLYLNQGNGFYKKVVRNPLQRPFQADHIQTWVQIIKQNGEICEISQKNGERIFTLELVTRIN